MQEKVSSQVAKAEERWYSPVVIQLARGANIPKEELDSIQGTGYEGRLSKKDIKDYIEKKKGEFPKSRRRRYLPVMHLRLLCLLRLEGLAL